MQICCLKCLLYASSVTISSLLISPVPFLLAHGPILAMLETLQVPWPCTAAFDPHTFPHAILYLGKPPYLPWLLQGHSGKLYDPY